MHSISNTHDFHVDSFVNRCILFCTYSINKISDRNVCKQNLAFFQEDKSHSGDSCLIFQWLGLQKSVTLQNLCVHIAYYPEYSSECWAGSADKASQALCFSLLSNKSGGTQNLRPFYYLMITGHDSRSSLSDASSETCDTSMSSCVDIRPSVSRSMHHVAYFIY